MIARYSWQLLRAGPLRLDGGGMFGIIPRVIWRKLHTPDREGRIKLAHNCLLLERAGQQVLIETGSGDKFDKKFRKIFGLTNYSIIDALREANVRGEDIPHVIVSHLHFDHAGGLTHRVDEDDIGYTFPNATVHVQRREWEDALANRSTMTRTYLLEENLDPIRGQVQLYDTPLPFSLGYQVKRDEFPHGTLRERETEILPGIFVFKIPGHTWGQQAIRFTDEFDRTVVFSADLIPTAAHVGLTYNMAYDVEPYTSSVTRRWFLKEAAEKDWLLVLDHEPGNPLRRVRDNDKGWFELVEAE